MQLHKVRLVISDMDGTLLNSQGLVSNRFYSIFEELKAVDVHFVAASGRQYYSIIDKLDRIKNDITVIAENGGITSRKEEILQTMAMSPDVVKTLIKKIRSIDDAHMVLCGKKQAYVESDHEEFLDIFNEYYLKYKKIDDLIQINDDEFFKIAIYSFGGSESTTYPHFKKMDENFKAKVSAENWLDISASRTDKGAALSHLQAELGIAPHETMVFGDFNNDVEMMEKATYSYAMANAHPNVKATARFETKSNDDQGVELILEKLIAAKKNHSVSKGC